MKAFDSKGNLLVSYDLSENEDATDGYILVNGALFGYDDEEDVLSVEMESYWLQVYMISFVVSMGKR